MATGTVGAIGTRATDPGVELALSATIPGLAFCFTEYFEEW
jgi:hypothetical protein